MWACTKHAVWMETVIRHPDDRWWVSVGMMQHSLSSGPSARLLVRPVTAVVGLPGVRKCTGQSGNQRSPGKWMGQCSVIFLTQCLPGRKLDFYLLWLAYCWTVIYSDSRSECHGILDYGPCFYTFLHSTRRTLDTHIVYSAMCYNWLHFRFDPRHCLDVCYCTQQATATIKSGSRCQNVMAGCYYRRRDWGTCRTLVIILSCYCTLHTVHAVTMNISVLFTPQSDTNTLSGHLEWQTLGIADLRNGGPLEWRPGIVGSHLNYRIVYHYYMPFWCLLHKFVSCGVVLLFRNKNRTSEEQLAYAEYYRREEEAATVQQLELVCLPCISSLLQCAITWHS